MFSIAVSLFNIEKMEYDWASSLSNFLAFADELVININKSEDSTERLVTEWAEKQTERPVKLILSDFPYSDPDLDGKCKNNAVLNCAHQFIILLDVDERILASQRKQWERLALEYIQKDKTDTIMIPSINCWGSEEKAKNVGQKWYIQRQGIRRGIVDFARNKNGTFNIDKSDGCEPLLNKEGNLARSLALIPPQANDYEKISLIHQNDLPYVLHLGDVDFDKRILRNQNFWQTQWNQAAGQEVNNLIKNVEEMEKVQTFDHGLKLKDEVILEEQKLIEDKNESNG